MTTTGIASGRTTPGATAWQVYTPSGIYVDVDTSAAQLSGTPVYLTSLGGNGQQWQTIGATSIYSPTATGFRVYVRWVDYAPLSPATANKWEWYINWIALAA